MDVIDPDWGCNVQNMQYELAELGEVDEILLRIHSRGGSVFEGLAMYTILAEHPARVRSRVIGLAASAATLPMMAGDIREVSESGFVMIHDPWLITAGNAAHFRRQAEYLDQIRPTIVHLYRRRSGESEEQFSEWMSAADGGGTWFDAEAAVEAGLADAIYAAPAVQNRVNLEGLEGIPEKVRNFFDKDPASPKALVDVATPAVDNGDADPQQQESVFADVLQQIRNPSPGTFKRVLELHNQLRTTKQPEMSHDDEEREWCADRVAAFLSRQDQEDKGARA